jgi:hypothetical protein
MVIGLPCHGRQNFKQFGDEIPAPRSPLPAHVLAFPLGISITYWRLANSMNQISRLCITDLLINEHEVLTHLEPEIQSNRGDKGYSVIA